MASLLHFFLAGGWVMWPLLALSIICATVIVERLLAFRQMGHHSPLLLSKVLSLCGEARFEEALRLCREARGPVAACVATAIERREQSAAQIERRVEEVGQGFWLRLERGLNILDTATTISPLLGLLGTILGMIGAFNAIGAQQARGNPDTVLSGVGEALYATAMGITIAVVSFIAYNGFAARIRQLTGETELAVTRVLNVLDESKVLEESTFEKP
jgi:biopolymer transport protein ExbB